MKVLVIGLIGLKRLLRDRTTLFFVLGLPVVIILVIGLATQRFEGHTLPVGIAQLGDGPLAAELAEHIAASPIVEPLRYDDPEELGRAVRRGIVLAGVVIPPDYDDRVATDESRVRFVADPTRGFPAPIRAVVAAAAAEQGGVLQAARFATVHGGGDLPSNLALAREVSAEVEAIGVRAEALGDEDPISFGTGFGYQAPANLVLFVFITSIAGAALVIEARQLGITRRMLGTPTSARTVLAGQALGRFVVAAFQAGFIWVVGTVVFGVHWGDPLGAAALIFVFVLVGTAVGMLFGTVFRTPEQAAAVGPPVGIGLGMLGGCMWPLEIVPDGMRIFGHLFPHAWAMDAWIKLTAFGAGIGGIATELGILAGYVAVLLPVAAWRLHRSIAW